MARRTAQVAPQSVPTHQRNSRVEVSILQKRVPRLPHERDQSADNEASEPREVIKQAAADLDRGLKDTDRSVLTNQTYRRLKADS